MNIYTLFLVRKKFEFTLSLEKYNVDGLVLGTYISSLDESWNIASESSDIVDSSSIFKRKKTPGGMKYAKKGNLPYTLGAEMGRGEKR